MAIDTDIRLALKQLIKNIYPTAQIFAWNALSHNIDEWSGMFRTSDGKTHGWIIKRASLKAERKNAQRDRKTLRYDVWGFYKFESNEATNELNNSDNEFGEIVDGVYEAVRNSHNLALPGTVEYHDLIQFPGITTLTSGEETLHFAQGSLVVHLCC